MSTIQQTPSPAGNGRLERRLSLLIAGLMATSALVLGALGLRFEWQAITQGLDAQLSAIARTTALHIDGDQHQQIHSDSDTAYKAIQARLAAVRQSEGLLYVYTVVPAGGEDSALVVDGSEEVEPIGTIYPDEPGVKQVMTTGQTLVQPIENVEGYGRLKTAYAPIRNSQGAVVAVLGVDMAAERILRELLRDSLFFGLAWLLVTVLGVLIALRVARSIAHRIEPLSAGARLLAAGNLSTAFGAACPVRRPDELDELSTSLAAMQRNLAELVQGMHRKAGEVVTAAGDLTAGVDTVKELAQRANEAMNQVASGTQEQAGNAAEVAGFVTQFRARLGQMTDTAILQSNLVSQAAEEASAIAAVIEQVVEMAGRAATMAAETTDVARMGSQAVGEAAGAVQQIAGTVSEASEGMARLSHQAADIGQISATIRDLAEQSNLLALNAAIEAARAGESGRGFAVVADEVRKLAARSRESAERISQILETIRRDIETSLGQMSASLAALANGREKAARAQGALASIEEAAVRTRDEIERMAADSRENARVARAIGEKARQAAQQVLASTETNRQVADCSLRAQTAMESVAAISEKTATVAANTQALMNEVARTLSRLASAGEQLGQVAREMEESASRFEV